MKPSPTHWTARDTALTLLVTIAAVSALIAAIAGWDFGALS